MSRRLALALCAALVTPLGLAAAAGPAQAAPAFTRQAVLIKVTVPADDCADPNPTVAADLYVPTGGGGPYPAILTTNGFGGDKSDQAGSAQAFASHGYVVLSYSGLGSGGSSCRISLDDREHDGAVGSQLLQYLGGKTGVGFLDARGSARRRPPTTDQRCRVPRATSPRCCSTPICTGTRRRRSARPTTRGWA